MRCEMRRILLAALLLLVALPAAASSFDDVVAAVKETTNFDRQYVPFMGVVRSFARLTGYNGVHDIRLAVFESQSGASAGRLDVATVDRLVGHGWQKFITVSEKRSGEQTSMYARPDGKLLRMMIVTIEDREAVVIEMKIEPEKLAAWIERENHPRRGSSRSR
jgi:hypothetical protein